MKKTKIVGHRGATGVELENTIRGFKFAKSLGVDAIEFDVLPTRDGAFVVCHDNDLSRLTGVQQFISQMTFAELAEIHLANGETIPLLYDVLAIVGKIPVVIDIKSDRHLDKLFEILAKYPKLDITIVTELGAIIKDCKQFRPDIPAFVQRHHSPAFLLRSVKKHGADGLNLNYYWLNPLLYWQARRKGLKIQAYTVNNVLVARMIKRLYPGVWICTNHPDVFLKSLK